MTEQEVQSFVEAFAAAWASKDPAAFVALWHPEGRLHTPFVNRIVKGSEIGALNALYAKVAPDLVWNLLGWTSRGNVVVIEWENVNRYGDQQLRWRGVDRMTIEEGRILEEVVYADTAPLHARRQGTELDALMHLPD